MNNPFEEFKNIEETNVITGENTALQKIDDFEDKIKLIDTLTKEYDKLKKDLKETMLKAGKEINAEQVKWITPKGIKITCSIGKKAEFEEVTEKKFNLEVLMKNYPDIYEKCLVEHTYNKTIKNASNDRLAITLPKED